MNVFDANVMAFQCDMIAVERIDLEKNVVVAVPYNSKSKTIYGSIVISSINELRRSRFPKTCNLKDKELVKKMDKIFKSGA